MKVTCPSGMVIEGRKLSGAEIKTLTQVADRHDGTNALASVLRACTVAVEDPGPYSFSGAPNWKQVVEADVLSMLLALRRSVFGSTFDFEARCQNCGQRNALEAELDFVTTPLPASSADALRAKKSLEATARDGSAVRFELHTLQHQEYLLEQLKQMKRRPEWADHTPSIVDRVAAQLKYVDGLNGANGENVSGEFVRRLEWLLKSDADVLFDLRAQMDAAEADIDTRVEFTCTACRWEQMVSIPLGSGFFMPTKKKKPTTNLEPSSS